jgi:phosphate acetyltransferase
MTLQPFEGIAVGDSLRVTVASRDASTLTLLCAHDAQPRQPASQQAVSMSSGGAAQPLDVASHHGLTRLLAAVKELPPVRVGSSIPAMPPACPPRLMRIGWG